MPDLPLNIIAVNNLGEDVMMPVKWDSTEITAETDSCFVKGYLQNNVTVNAVITFTEDRKLLNPCLDKEKVIDTYSIKNVRLLHNSGFYEQQQRVMEHFLCVDCDSYIYNFRQAAGLDTKGAKPMTGWDAPQSNIKGHTTGHFLSGLALCYAATGNKQIKSKLDYMVQELGICQDTMAQQPDKFREGFLSAYNESQFDLLEVYTVYPKIWAPYYTLHKIMAGLRDCYLYADNAQAFEILKKIGLDLLLKDESVTIEKLFGHGGLFKIEGIAQQMMASALNTPVQVTTAASEGGAWGMAILAEYMNNSDMPLADYLQNIVFADAESTVCAPNPEETAGFEKYLVNYKKAIEIEKTAVKQLI